MLLHHQTLDSPSISRMRGLEANTRSSNDYRKVPTWGTSGMLHAISTQRNGAWGKHRGHGTQGITDFL